MLDLDPALVVWLSKDHELAPYEDAELVGLHACLGFKSVEKITDTPQILSTDVAFGFDAERARAAAEIVQTTSGPVCGLRSPVSGVRSLQSGC
jgi:hypothetical protein